MRSLADELMRSLADELIYSLAEVHPADIDQVAAAYRTLTEPAANGRTR
jgi:hypothetical protein